MTAVSRSTDIKYMICREKVEHGNYIRIVRNTSQ